jgi:hypothetical protein
VDPADRCRRHWSADVALPPLRGAVTGRGRAVTWPSTVAEDVAAAQVRVETVKDVDAVLQLPQGHVAKGGLQRPPNVPNVGFRSTQLVIDDLHPPVEENADRRVMVRQPVGFHLSKKPLGVGLGVPTVAPGFPAQVGLLAGERVLPGVHAGAEARAQHLDGSPRHDVTVGR